MKLYTKKDLGKYLENDWILKEINKYPKDDIFVSQKWLKEIPAKRMIYADVYGELLKTKGKKILDVGGSFCGLSRILVKNHDYTLIDIMAHESQERIKKVESEIGKFWVDSDWLDFEIKTNYDLIIANDIFPNVDQRLGKFIKKFIPYAKSIIITLTCYEEDRFYKVKRIDADEIFTIQPWTSSITSLVLTEALGQQVPVLEKTRESVFKNGRIVYKVILS